MPGPRRVRFAPFSAPPAVHAGWFCALAGLAGIPGCGSPETVVDTLPAQSQNRRDTRLDAAWGSLIVVPAARLPAAVAAALEVPALLAHARTDDGQPVTIEVRNLITTPGLSPIVPPTNRRGWLPPSGEWSTAPDTSAAREAVAARPSEYAARFAILTLPLGTLGQGVWIGDVRLDVNWLPSSRTIAARLPQIEWTSPLLADAAASPIVRAALDAERSSPFRRWRAKLAAGSLIPSASASEQPDIDAFADPALEVIASQMEERWTVALARLGEADTKLLTRVRRALVLTASVASASGSAVVPVWPTDQAVLDELLSDLLRPRATPLDRREAAERFLERVPTSVGWILDDASALDATTLAPVVVVGAANFTAEPIAASLRWPRSFSTADLVAIPPLASSRLTAPQAEFETQAAGSTLSARVGDWLASLPASPLAVPVQPPGLLLAPLWPDWNCESWIAGAPRSPAAPTLAVSLIRTPNPNPRERAVSEGWVLYGEVAGGRAVTGVIRVWLGPAATNRAAIMIDLAAQSAAAVDTPEGEPAATRDPSAPRIFSIALPSDTITHGRLLLGVDAQLSTPSGETHLAWPRPMFPWQTVPSRAAIDLTAWGGIAKPRAR